MPYDNSVSESAFKSLKHAWLKSSNYNTESELIEDVSIYVSWYNNIRLHSKLGYKSPIEFRLTQSTI